MTTQSGRATTPSLGVRRYNVGSSIIAAYIAIFLLYILFLEQQPNSTSRAWVSDIVSALASFVPALLALRTARNPLVAKHARKAWLIIGFGMLVNWAGDTLWAYYELGLGIAPYPSWADAFYLAFHPLMLWGLLLFSAVPRSRNDAIKFWLDVVIVVLSGTLLMWHTVIWPSVIETGNGGFTAVLAITYPIGDLAALFGAAIVLLGCKTHSHRRSIILLAIGLLSNITSDVLYGYATVQGVYQSGSWIDIGWLLCYLLVAIGAHIEYTQPHHSNAECQAPQTPRMMNPLPYLSIAIVYTVVVNIASQDWPHQLRSLMIGASILTALVAARQIFAAWENTRLLTEQAHQRSEERFHTLVQNISDVIAVIDIDTSIRYITPSVESVLGIKPETLLGVRMLTLVHEVDVPQVVNYTLQAAQSKTSGYSEWRMCHHNGNWLYIEAVADTLTEENAATGLILTMRNVTERKQLEDRLSHQAFHDSLTNLANRALLHDRIKHALTRQKRQGGQVAVLFLDLDDFKKVNDTLGHSCGDDLLCEVARCLLGCVRPGDTVARLGGDEFAILLEDLNDCSEAEVITQNVITSLEQPKQLGGRELVVSTSIGIATSLPDFGAEEILRNADVALYTAKRRGKGSYQMFEASMYSALLTRMELETEMRASIHTNQFIVHYQPVVCLATHRVAGVEALVRWEHPVRGVLQPNAFIPLAEETGLIVPVGMQVLRSACQQLQAWRQAFGEVAPDWVSVNLSARQIADPELVPQVAQVLASTGLDAHRLLLEITEGIMLEDDIHVRRTLEHLKELGIRLAIDDFGTGYSTLSYLQRLPIDVLKIDKSFVDDLTREEGQTALADLVVALSERLHLSAIAEGVEEEQQRQHLQSMGCEFGQGYLFNRPMPPGDLESLLTTVQVG